MDVRAETEALVKELYATRVRGDLDRAMEYFSDGAQFSLAGSPMASPVPLTATGAAAVREVLRRLFDSFTFLDWRIVSLIVEGNNVAVHSAVHVRANGSGAEATTEIVDLIRFESGRVVSYHQFADTALAARLLAA